MSGRSHLTSYEDIFEEVVSIVSHDYAGCDGVKGCDLPDVEDDIRRLGSRSNHRSDAKFLKLVRRYIAGVGDPNIQIIKISPEVSQDWNIGFSVRAWDDCLYVTDEWADDRLHEGDRIVAINGHSINDIRAGELGRTLYGKTSEREVWDHVLQYAKTLEVERDGRTVAVEPTHNEMSVRSIVESEPVLYCQPIDDDTVYIRLDSLEDVDEVAGIVFENEGRLRKAEKLVLDLRHCQGGGFDGIEPLLPFLIDVPQSFMDFMGSLGLYYRYSEGNCKRMVASVEAQAEVEFWSDDELEAEVERIEALEDAGLVFEEVEYPDEWMVPVEPDEGPERVVVLVDTTCCNEGEQLVEALRRQAKATVVGRPTLGSSDYQELFTVNYEDDLLFVYPVAMTSRAESGKGLKGLGVDVHVYVPWTPAEIETDVLMEKALAL